MYHTFSSLRDLLPSEGGKYVGFGSSPIPPDTNNDYMGSTMASLSSVSRIILTLMYFISSISSICCIWSIGTSTLY